jgi:transcriptional regulator with GAF, ATPase, and Fis domain
MNRNTYRRKAILTRVHEALDAFYMLQKIDWQYDIRETLDRILALALEEIELEGEKTIERALLIVQSPDGEDLEVKAGWKVGGADLSFSRTVVQQTFQRGEAILCENVKDDPRFMHAESIKELSTLSLISVPLPAENGPIGVFYVESDSAGTIFNSEDLAFLQEFAATITPYIKTGLTHQDHVREIRKLKEEVSDRYSFGNIIGRSASIQNVFELARVAAGVDRTVLLTGESGCGKELIAKAIHFNGRRRDGRFVVVDCSSLVEHLLESELFGHVKGAFTGASHDKIGAFEEANGGTLFLDEIGDASKPMQQKLRRVLQEGEIKRVGENKVRQVDVRVICATNKDLAALVRSGHFIQDLYFRINKFPIHIPTLRDRREDIPLLVHHFLERLDRGKTGASPRPRKRGISPDALAMLVARDWRENNIRELRNTVELTAELARGDSIEVADLERVFRIQAGVPPNHPVEIGPSGATIRDAANDRLVSIDRARFQALLRVQPEAGHDRKRPRNASPFYRAQLEFEARVIIEALRSCAWKIRPAARLLGISPMKLRGALKEHLAQTCSQAADKLETVASSLDIPIEVLRKKARDLGLASVRRSE